MTAGVVWIPWRLRNEHMMLWNRAARGKSLRTQEWSEYTEKPGEMGVPGTEGALALSHCTWWPMNVRGCPVSIQSSSGAGGRSKYEGCCEVEATWLKKTNRSQAGRQGPLAMRTARMRFVSMSWSKLQNVLRGIRMSNKRFPNSLLPVCPFPASRCWRALFWVWHCLRLSLIQEK